MHVEQSRAQLNKLAWDCNEEKKIKDSLSSAIVFVLEKLIRKGKENTIFFVAFFLLLPSLSYSFYKGGFFLGK